MKRLGLLFALSLLLAACAGSPAAIQSTQQGGAPSADRVNAVAKNLYCPVCANVPLDVCGTAACVQWRGQIAELLAEGYSEQQVYDYFAAQYGQGVLALPPARGLNWLVYLIPPLGIGVAALFLGRNLKRWKQPAATSQTKLDDDYARKLEEELKARR
ncbi:MAG TPA: cytochrome c-type biogenesis protein CcmH [Anaerolineales bacterium]|nr:cytochrome c-type biogenesis protein CcmH [Anaerolineales bacterium]HRQ93113.1 cytochrome c-type biogenesis protein CcmH [Anaerolineales bacterium]